jgi:transposase
VNRFSGIKRHIAVDTRRRPHAITVTTAEVTDRKGALEALERNKPNLKRVKSLLCDGGYTEEPFAQGVRAILGESVTVQIAKRNERHTFKVLPKRWVVERSFAWLAGEKPETVEKLRTKTQHQSAIHPSGLLGGTA